MRAALGMAVLASSALGCAARSAAPPAATPATSPRPVHFTPGTARYRGASYTHLEQRVGDQTQQSDEARVLYLTANLMAQGQGLRVVLTVDSVPRYHAGPAASGVEGLRGVTFTGELAPDGEIHGMTGGDSTIRAMAELADGLSRMYPRIPAGGVEPGARWTDTTETTSKTGGLPLTVVAVSRHEADLAAGSGSDTVLPIRTTTTYTFSGQGSQGGQTYSVNGEGRRHTVELLGLGGLFRRMTLADTSTFTVSLPAMDVSIPGRQTRADTLSIIP